MYAWPWSGHLSRDTMSSSLTCMSCYKSGVGLVLCLLGMLASTDLIAVVLFAVLSDMILQLSGSILLDVVLVVGVVSLSCSDSCSFVASSGM